MARGIHTRKRSRPSSSSKGRTFKRRRTARRGKRSTNFTSQSGIGGGLQFKARRTSRSAYKKHLWDSTLFKEHYRTNSAFATTIATPASQNSMTVLGLEAMRFATNPFYTAAGGAIAPDSAQALPTFTGNPIIRGGMIGMRIANTVDTAVGSTNSLQGTVFLLRTTKNWVPAAITTPVSLGWDPTLVQDFDTVVGKIVYKKHFLLKDTDVATIEYRLKTTKIDVGDYVNTRNTFVWLVLAGNVDNTISHSFAITQYYNMSFAADAV